MKLIFERTVKYGKLAVLFSVLASVGILMGEKGLIEKRQREEKQGVLQRDNERLALEIKELERSVTLLRTDPGTIEKVAKRELGMARPDETVYIFERASRPIRRPDKRSVSLRKGDNLP